MSAPHNDPPSTVGVGGVFSHALDLLTDAPHLLALSFLGTLSSQIPLLGNLVNVAVSGVGVAMAYDTAYGGHRRGESVAVRLLRLVLAAIVAAIVILVGLLFLVVPGIYLGLKFALFVPAIMVDDHGPVDGLKESWARTDGHLGTVFGVNFLLGAVAVVLVLVLALALGFEAFVAMTEFRRPGLLLGFAAISAPVGALSYATSAVMYRAFGGSRDEAYGVEEEW